MLTVFWDTRGVLYMELLTKGSKVNSDRYCATLRSLKQRICRIRPKRETFRLHHNNARSLCSAQTEDAMTSLKVQWFHTLLAAHIWHRQTSDCSEN